MGLFGPFKYKAKDGTVYYVHMYVKGKKKFYYLSPSPENALGSLPKGFEIVEHESGLVFLRKKKSKGFLSWLFDFSQEKKEKEEIQGYETSEEKKKEKEEK